MRLRPAKDLTTKQISDELDTLDAKWRDLRAALEECGGASGSPGEWLIERMGELETEMERRKAAGTAA